MLEMKKKFPNKKQNLEKFVVRKLHDQNKFGKIRYEIVSIV